MEIQSGAVEFANSAHRATPWVELELNSLSASEKAIEYENTVNLLHIYLPYAYSNKPVQFANTTGTLYPVRDQYPSDFSHILIDTVSGYVQTVSRETFSDWENRMTQSHLPVPLRNSDSLMQLSTNCSS